MLEAPKKLKTGFDLICDGERKRNRFDTGLTSITALHCDSSLKTVMQSNLLRQPNIEPIPLHCSGMDQTMTTFFVFQSEFENEFSMKRF